MEFGKVCRSKQGLGTSIPAWGEACYALASTLSASRKKGGRKEGRKEDYMDFPYVYYVHRLGSAAVVCEQSRQGLTNEDPWGLGNNNIWPHMLQLSNRKETKQHSIQTWQSNALIKYFVGHTLVFSFFHWKWKVLHYIWHFYGKMHSALKGKENCYS